jgi:hypothetical protein
MTRQHRRVHVAVWFTVAAVVVAAALFVGAVP